MSRSPVTLYHYAKCSKSRATLALLESQGVQPEIIYYLEQPLDISKLQQLMRQLGVQSARQLMRQQEEAYRELNLANPTLSEVALLQAIVDHPILLERPIVVYQDQARVGRPPEAILELF